MEGQGLPYRMPARKRRRFVFWPKTPPGKWAVGLAAVSMALVSSWSLLGRIGGLPGLAFGMAGGIAALVAIFRRGERALTVFVALVPLLIIVFFLVAELLGSD